MALAEIAIVSPDNEKVITNTLVSLYSLNGTPPPLLDASPAISFL
jgi:hypothetical protein